MTHQNQSGGAGTPTDGAPGSAALNLKQPSPLGGSVDSVMLDLFQRAKDSLSVHELERLEGLTDDALELAKHLSSVSTALGCMLMVDGDSNPGGGNFQSAAEVAPLLMLLGEMASRMAATLEISHQASNALWLRRRADNTATARGAQ